MIKNNWPRIKKHLLPRFPRTLFYWRFFLPNQPDYIQFHRKAFIKSLTLSPKPIRGLLNLYSLLLWYGFFAWRNSYRVWSLQHKNLNIQQGISPTHQFFQLLKLSIIYCIPAKNYYQLSLYKHPEKQWLTFVFNHQATYIHAVVSPNISPASSKLMADKHYFSQILAQNNLSAVPTITFIKANATLDKKLLFKQQSFFLKPNKGSRKKGCFALIYSAENQNYYLKGEGINIQGRDKIIAFISSLIKHTDYLIQPLLCNSAKLGNNAAKQDLFTIRLITAIVNNKPEVISAILEVPVARGFIERFIIDCLSGNLTIPKTVNSNNDQSLEKMTELVNRPFSNWEEIKEIALCSHQLCSDIKTVGWDISLTTLGVVILEGNINWALLPHQLEGSIKTFIHNEQIRH